MAIQYTDSTGFGSSDTAAHRADVIYDIFSKHSNAFSHTTDTDIIRVNNQFDIRISLGGNVGTQTVFNILNPTDSSVIRSQTTYMGGNAAGTYDVYTLISDSIFYIRFYLQNTTANQGCVFCWINLNNKNYVSITPDDLYNTPRSSWNIENDRYITCVEEADTTYSIKKLADYRLSIRDVFFSNINVMATTAGGYTTIPDFKSSSTLNYPSVISVNNKNYYTVGTNTLIEIDEES